MVMSPSKDSVGSGSLSAAAGGEADPSAAASLEAVTVASTGSGSSSLYQYSLHGNAAATIGPHSSRPGSAASSQQVRIFCFFRTIGQILL